NFAKLESGSVRFREQDVDLPAAVSEGVTLLTPQLNARRLQCIVAPPRVDVHALAVPEKLDQILMNLLSNAIKFTPEGGRVTVEFDVEGAATRVHEMDAGAVHRIARQNQLNVGNLPPDRAAPGECVDTAGWCRGGALEQPPPREWNGGRPARRECSRLRRGLQARSARREAVDQRG